MLKLATLIATLVLAGSFASYAEAHGMGSFYASPFFRNQGRQPAQPCEKDKRRSLEEAFARSRAKRLAELRAERAEASAAAAKRAHLAALQQKKTAAAKAAKRAAAAKSRSTVAQRGDLLPVASAPKTTETVASAAPQLCRRYSAAADSVIEIPCK